MDAEFTLDALEARILGVLAEKQLTTPEQYPLTVNAATAGCNQKSNRNPVMDVPESHVQVALEKLMVRGYVGLVHAAGGRVDRYRHNLAEHLNIDQKQLALMTTMLLRGPQTRGELRTHCNRMAEFPTLDAIADAALPLLERELIERLPPAAGSRSVRFAQMLAPGLHPQDSAPQPTTAPISDPANPSLTQRVADLEETVRSISSQLRELTEQLGGA